MEELVEGGEGGRSYEEEEKKKETEWHIQRE